tara:strand:+ start:3582 stop:4331 length:750 start_codon:yes stop_codon:yes gene_type:complete
MTLQSNLDCKIIIPARYKSSRFEGKPLAPILGIPMIKRVWSQCIKAASEDNVFVATDSKRINDFCSTEGMRSIMTSENCLTGTDRVFEASQKIDADLYINVQGDEPLIDPSDIHKVIEESLKNPGEIINAMAEISDENDFRSSAVPKVICDIKGNLLYMSRAPIPTNKNNEFIKAYKQVCIYAFPRHTLESFASNTTKTTIEAIEDIEILRFLEMGIKVKMIEVSQSSIAVDYPEDIEKVENVLQGHRS